MHIIKKKIETSQLSFYCYVKVVTRFYNSVCYTCIGILRLNTPPWTCITVLIFISLWLLYASIRSVFFLFLKLIFPANLCYYCYWFSTENGSRRSMLTWRRQTPASRSSSENAVESSQKCLPDMVRHLHQKQKCWYPN